MSSPRRVQNITNGYWYRPSQLQKAFDACAIAWVEEGKTVRSLDLKESIAERNNRALLREEPLPYHEIPGILYEPAKRNERQHYAGMEQVWAAHQFAREARA